MSRANYSDGFDDQWSLIRWRGAVARAIRGKRGQAFLRELIEALDALPHQRLIVNELENGEGVCALGSVGRKRLIPMTDIDPEDCEAVSRVFGIPEALVREIEFLNDDYWNETPEHRFQRIRAWAIKQLTPTPPERGG